MGGHKDLHVFPRGTVNAQVYRDDIIDAYVRPYAGAISDAFWLHDDSVRPHRDLIVDGYLQQGIIMRMEWPVRSPDLNPIEHVWDDLGKRLAVLNSPPQTLAGLATALQERWLVLGSLRRKLITLGRHTCAFVLKISKFVVGRHKHLIFTITIIFAFT